MDKPLVSIITPFYNSEKFLGETIESALGQTWPNKELILVDDGSSDGSLSVAQGRASENVRVICQHNRGASAARNRGLQEARGEYIQFLDADDLLSPDKISNQVAALRAQPGKLAACSTIHFRNGLACQTGVKTRNEEAFLFDDDDPVHFLVNLLGGYQPKGSMIGVHAWLTPRSVIERSGNWNESISTDDDGEFFSRVILSSSGIIKTDGQSYYRKYQWGSKSLSHELTEESIDSMFKATLLKKDHLEAYKNVPAVDIAIYKQLLYLALKAYLKFPGLYRRIALELRKYPDVHAAPLMGGRRINAIARIFGWKTASILQYCSARLGIK